MMRVVLSLVGLVGAIMVAAIVHLVAVLAVPAFVPDPVFAGLVRLGPEFRFHLVRAAAADSPVAWLDPAFAHAVCRFSLEAGPVRIRPRLPDVLWSLSLHEPDPVSVYDVNDRGAGERALDLIVADADQIASLQDRLPPDARDPIVVTWSGPDQGFAFIRAFVPASSARAEVEAALAESRCETLGRAS